MTENKIIVAKTIGPPGTGKTILAKEVMKLRLNSRYVSSKNTTGLSLTAMILKEGDDYVLHVGPVPLSKGAICVINEFDKLEENQQDNLLDVMEEGEITLNKFARLKKIPARTTIVATANPQHNRWTNPNNITAEDIPIARTKISRFDIILIFEDTKDIEENRKFAEEKTGYDRKGIKHNYNFLVKYIEYARSINPIISPEAQSILNEYWARLSATEGLFVTPRLLDALGRMAQALARLYLQKVADEEIARKVIDLVNKTMRKFMAEINNIPDPRILAYDETLNVIRKQQGKPIDLMEGIKMACQKYPQIRYYLGNTIEQSRNIKVRNLCDRIVEHHSVLRTNIKPLVVMWNEDSVGTSGSADSQGKDGSDPSTIKAEGGSHGSHTSQTSQEQCFPIAGTSEYDTCDQCHPISPSGGEKNSSRANDSSVGNSLDIPKDIQKIIADCVAFDSEWDPVTHSITAAAFVDTNGNRKVLQLTDFGGSEQHLILAYINELMKHQASVGWSTIGLSAGGKKPTAATTINDSTLSSTPTATSISGGVIIQK